MVGSAQIPAAHDAGQIALDERDAGALHGDIRARAHGHAHIGLGQRRRVIDTVARHRDHAPFGSQAPNDGILLIRAAPRPPPP